MTELNTSMSELDNSIQELKKGRAAFEALRQEILNSKPTDVNDRPEPLHWGASAAESQSPFIAEPASKHYPALKTSDLESHFAIGKVKAEKGLAQRTEKVT